MNFFINLFNIFMHLDIHLNEMIINFGIWTYLILFLIIFSETGLVVTPFLPGDSLLFAVGAIAVSGSINIFLIYFLLIAAAILGNMTNYTIGHFIGPKVFKFKGSFFFKKEYLERTHKFYEKHGGKTIIITRFMPILRTFAPFIAGVGYMSYLRFSIYNLIGGFAWVSSFIWAGYFFGNIPVVKRNFTIIIFIIIIISVMPAVIEFFRMKSKKKSPKE